MKYCVIGNSHVGMLRAAARLEGADTASITYFAKAGAGLDRATVRGSVIAADDPALAAAQSRFGMPREVDVSQFDAVIFVAGTASVFSALQVLQGFRISGWPSERGDRAGDAAGPRNRRLLSNAAYVDVLVDRTRSGVSYQFARALRPATERPMFVVPQPYPSERILEMDGPQGVGPRRVLSDGDGAALTAGLVRAVQRAFDEIEAVSVLAQPEDTVVHGFLTARGFGRDAVRVDGNTPQDQMDFLHVGPAFGLRVLERVRRGLER